MIIDKVAEQFGGRKFLAEFLGVTEQAVSQWAKEGYFPPAQALKLERHNSRKYKAVNLTKERE